MKNQIGKKRNARLPDDGSSNAHFNGFFIVLDRRLISALIFMKAILGFDYNRDVLIIKPVKAGGREIRLSIIESAKLVGLIEMPVNLYRWVEIHNKQDFKLTFKYNKLREWFEAELK